MADERALRRRFVRMMKEKYGWWIKTFSDHGREDRKREDSPADLLTREYWKVSKHRLVLIECKVHRNKSDIFNPKVELTKKQWEQALVKGHGCDDVHYDDYYLLMFKKGEDGRVMITATNDIRDQKYEARWRPQMEGITQECMAMAYYG